MPKSLSSRLNRGAVTAKKSRARPPRVGFFFGAGAEVTYGMPAGGRFALDIFREKSDDAKALFRLQRDGLNPRDFGEWLPEGYSHAKVYEFGKAEQTRVFQETLEVNRKRISSAFNSFDITARKVLEQLGGSERVLSLALRAATGKSLEESDYGSQIEFTAQLGATRLFGSHYFSAALDLCAGPGDQDIVRLASAVVRLLSGALGQDLVKGLNQKLFAKRPQGLDVLEVGELFRIDTSEAGDIAFFEVLARAPAAIDGDAGAAETLKSVLLGVLERTIESSISYEALMDEYYPFIFKPRDWARFSKISIFLHTVRAYINRLQDRALAAFAGGRGYYHDLADALTSRQIEVTAVGTSNYTGLLDRAMQSGETVYHLNGDLGEYLDPFLNRIARADAIARDRFWVPLIFTQSGTKPMTSINMSERYVEYYNNLKESDAIVVVGFGFNGDDGHINSLLRDLVDTEGKELIVLSYGDAESGEDLKELYRRRIRLLRSDKFRVLAVDEDRNCDDVPWLEAVTRPIELAPVSS
jgi:hypothetical protein